ncbi:Na+/H+ antiporter NhaD type [Jejuia pallidilutea]|uniref:Na+/H+ antiporter NhaD type n=1 Tax=Jejuia pallidilutea TaxID=504487 RepID=A0A090WNC6_9FLAO|nr:Na+/H+ antiporter NhaD type [Jejuia pallidilutea]GAL73075.1 Na+/H+ antiporter NhaD type [Jejuia pallidilutea]
MEAAIILVFVMGYLAITLEHSIKIDKLIPALVMMAICWALIALGLESFPQWFDSGNHALLENFGAFGHEEKMHLMEETLLHHLGKTAEILVFLLGAMTIVEIIDYFDALPLLKVLLKLKRKLKYSGYFQS